MFRKLILPIVLPICFIILMFALIEEPTAHALVVTEHISSGTTWTAANSPYIVQNWVTIEPSITLTIEAGVTVMFDGIGSFISIEPGAHLEAAGTEAAPILFTSVAEGGPGDWGSIGAHGSARFVYTEFRNAGHNVYVGPGGYFVLRRWDGNYRG